MTTLDPRALADSFAIYYIEDDEDSIRLSVNGEQIACWGANTDQGIALLKLEAARQESALPQPQAGEPAQVTDEQIIEIAVAHSNYKNGGDFEVFSHKRIVEFARHLLSLTAAIGAGGQAVAYEPCGGCGEKNPDKRCIGCLHPFSALSQPHPADERVVKALRKIEYCLTKDSLCEAEKIDDALKAVRRLIAAKEGR